MTVSAALYDHNRRERPGRKRFTEYGPFYQAHCHWCDELSDCYNTKREAGEWTLDHACKVTVTMEEDDE